MLIYLFNLRPGVLIKILSHKWGKLNLPTLLFKVGLLTLINLDLLTLLNMDLSIFIRVNNPTLKNNVGKFNLAHLWDRILINTLGLKLNK